MLAIVVLAQAAAADGVQDIVAHPYLTIVAMTGLFGSLVASIKVLLKFMERRMNEKFAAVELHNTRQDVRLDAIDLQLQHYDTHVAVGARESREIHSAIGRVELALAEHTTKEETTTWGKIDGLVDSVAEMKLGNEVAHAALTAGQLVLGARLDGVEKKMPNGDLAKLANAFEELAKGYTGAKKRSASSKR
jgi:hypothetical protein